MSLNLEQKKIVVDQLSAVLAQSQAAALAEYRGLTVAQMTALRRKARDSQIYVRVIKNNLARRAVEGSKFECLSDKFVGPLALAAGADPVALAKVLTGFAKENEQLRLTAAAIGGQLVSSSELNTLATLPSREQLLAMLVGTMQAPIRTFVQLLNQIPSKFVRTLAAVRDSKEQSGNA
ncbi:MAG: 50S ribosomal protein L10 [Acidiferrobacterales bacterium]|nr:50S ribosomal protein L10 [Acidiferrobacterales bacterium]